MSRVGYTDRTELEGGKVRITERAYNALHTDFRGVWDTERDDMPNWERDRAKFMGKRTMLHNFGGGQGTCLLIEGMGLEIVKG